MLENSPANRKTKMKRKAMTREKNDVDFSIRAALHLALGLLNDHDGRGVQDKRCVEFIGKT